MSSPSGVSATPSPSASTNGAGATNGRERGVEDELAGHVAAILELLGENPNRPGLRATPRRVARSLTYLTRGYRSGPRCAVGNALFEESHRDLVIVRDIEFHSLCEHHLLPFSGRVHIGYLPAGRVVGLSKLARVVGVFARRLQVQERLTRQIADALQDVLRPGGVAVAVEAEHMCMSIRGVEQSHARTLTRAFRGVFEEDRALRGEFLSSVGS